MEELPGYDKWKLTSPPEEDVGEDEEWEIHVAKAEPLGEWRGIPMLHPLQEDEEDDKN